MDVISTIEIIAATIGILYVYLELRASMWLWPVGIILPLFYIYLSWESKVYGNIVVNLYYIIACILGWREWMKQKASGSETDSPLVHWLSRRAFVIVVAVVLLLVGGIAPLLAYYMDSPYPIWDALATSVSLVGMWLLAKKYIETWYCWILSNIIYCLLYFLQGFKVTAGFFVIYSVVSFMGLYHWYRLYQKGEKQRSY